MGPTPLTGAPLPHKPMPNAGQMSQADFLCYCAEKEEEEGEESPWGSGKDRRNLRRSSPPPDITPGQPSHHGESKM